MRNQWYGDNRDLVKWSAIYQLALGKPTQILYVPMLTLDEPSFDELTLTGGRALPIEVVQHFRDANQAQAIRWPGTMKFLPPIEGFFEESNRKAYFDQVNDRLATLPIERERLLLFFDPDTGIQPPSGGDERHIRGPELKPLFLRLAGGDILAVYQHARHTKKWVEETRKALADALAIAIGKVSAIQCSELAWDVAMLVVEVGA